MKVVELRGEADLESLQPAWEGLLHKAALKTIFLSWDWSYSWWRAYGVPGELRILTAYSSEGELVGIAPLRAQVKKQYGQQVATLSFLADGSNDSDYLDFITAAGREREVLAAFHAHWSANLQRGAVFLLNEMPESSPHFSLLKEMALAKGLLWMEEDVPCATIPLRDTWEEYLSALKPRFRTKVRSVVRNLEDRPEVRCGFCKTREEIERLLPLLYDLHQRRWAADDKPGVFGWQQKRDFYRELSGRLLDRGWLRFSRLEWNGQVLACQFGFAYENVYSQLQEGYEPESEHWNPGVGLRAWTVREFIQEGIREYDQLGGMSRHKADWGAIVKHSKRIVMAQENSGNCLFCRGREWTNRAKDLARKLLPEKLLATQRTHLVLETGQQPAGENPAPVTGREKLRDAMAEIYFRFHIAGLAKHVRNRYRLAIVSNGQAPTISLKRRKQPTGRILYYHRINDDQDPFFPAMTTRLFDELMEFVSRHYNVVSLPEMMKRLQSGEPEQLMAITFDDGYRDNYEQAFPILQRYGLPATIFLSTGVIDSGEPLWFEQLALALKKTTREWIQLEFDIPRRYWTRTVAEKLDANRRINALLRTRSDVERREWLAEILQQLDVQDRERHGKMLTWDDIRLMNRQGIDFGGHTVTHPFISKLQREQVLWEVSECKRRIEAELQVEIPYFAYPNGREEDFGMANKELIRVAGYEAALTTIWGPNHRDTDPMELRRGGPWEENPAVFAWKLDWYELVGA